MARWDEAKAGEVSWGKWWIDQLGHFGLGAAYSTAWTAIAIYVLPLIGVNLGSWLIFAIGAALALFGGTLRELIQWSKSGFQMKKLHPTDRFFDAVFHIPGALVPGLWLLIRWIV